MLEALRRSYGIYKLQMKKIPNRQDRLNCTLQYMRGTFLSRKFEKISFINVRGKVRIYKVNGGKITIDNYVSISPHVMLSIRSSTLNRPAELIIGSMSHIGERTEIHCGNKVTIGKHVRIGWDCVIMDRDYHPLPGCKEETTAPVVIGDNVWIGCRAIILKGVKIGHDSIVGAGAVVIDDVEPCSMVVGNPARTVRTGLASCELPLSDNDY